MLFVSLSDDFVMTRVSDLWMTRTLNTEYYEIFSLLIAYILILSGYRKFSLLMSCEKDEVRADW